jgi:hypothetical protein
MQKVIVGVALALVLAAVASGATIFGIDAWKIALAAAGAAIFVMGGRSPGGER